MQLPKGIEVRFIAGFGPIVRDAVASRNLYQHAFSIPFKEEQGGYLHSEAVQGCRSFALWPLAHASQSCFGMDTWPDEIPVPQAWLEFDVDDVPQATAVLETQGYRMLLTNKTEPWGQTVSRFMSPEGLLVGITYTPQLREKQ